MKKVMEQYAGTVLAVAAALGIFSVFHSASFGHQQNIYGYLGTIMTDVVAREALDVKSGDAFNEYMDYSLPVFSPPASVSLKPRVTTPISRIIEARDSQGELLDIQVVGYWDENFQETTQVRVLNETKLSFLKWGVYWLEVCATDGCGYSRNALVKVYVNER